jgi:hypothetical protein
MLAERVRVTYPDLTQLELDDPPPEYSTLPPPSVADSSDLEDTTLPRTPAASSAAPRSHTHIPYRPPWAYIDIRPARPFTPVWPIPQTTTETQDVRSTFIPMSHVFKPSNFMPGFLNETAFHFTVTGLDERMTNLVDSLVELGLAAITVFGTLFTYWWGKRKAKREAREKERDKKVLEEWKAKGIMTENEKSMFTEVDDKGAKEKGKEGKMDENRRNLFGLTIPARLHAREWHLANS